MSKESDDYIMPDILIGLYLTNKCSNSCRNCFKSAGLKEKNELTLKEIETLAQIWERLYQDKKVRIVLSGGEPTLKDGFDKILTMFGNRKIFDEVLLFSNGERIPEYAELIKKYKVSTCFTCYGPEQTHDKIAGRDGAFQDLIRAAKVLKKGIRFLAFRENLNQGQEIAELVKRLGSKKFIDLLSFFKIVELIKKTDIARPMLTGRGKDIQLLSDEEFKRLRESIIKAGVKVDCNSEQNLDEILKEEGGKYCPDFFTDTIDISCTGEVHTKCCFASGGNKEFSQKFYVGNIRNDDWEDLISKSRKLNKRLNFDRIISILREQDVKFPYPMDRCNYCIKLGGPDAW